MEGPPTPACMDPTGNSHPMDLSSWNTDTTTNGYANVNANPNAYVNGYNSYANEPYIRPQEQMIGAVNNYLNMSTVGFPLQQQQQHQQQSQDDILSMALDMSNVNGQVQASFPSPSSINIRQYGMQMRDLFCTPNQIPSQRSSSITSYQQQQQMSSHLNILQQNYHQMMSNNIHQQQFQGYQQVQHQLPPYQPPPPFNHSLPQYNQLNNQNQSSPQFSPCPPKQPQIPQSQSIDCLFENLPFAEYPKADDYMGLDGLVELPPLPNSDTSPPQMTDIVKSKPCNNEVNEDVVEMELDKEAANEVVSINDIQELQKEQLKARAQIQLQKLAAPAHAAQRMMTPADAAIAKVALDQQLAKQIQSPPKKGGRRPVDYSTSSAGPSSSLPSFGATFSHDTTTAQQSQKPKNNPLLAARIPADLKKQLVPTPNIHSHPAGSWTRELTEKLIEAKLATRKIRKIRDKKVMIFTSQLEKEEQPRVETKVDGPGVEKVSPMKSLMDFASGSCGTSDLPPLNPTLDVEKIVEEMKKNTEAASSTFKLSSIVKRKANAPLQAEISRAIKYYKAQASQETHQRMLNLFKKVKVRKEAFEKSDDIDVNNLGPFASITPHNSKERFRLHDLKYEPKKPEEITNHVSKKNEARYVAAPSEQRRKTSQENEGLYEVGSYLIRASDVRKHQSEVNLFQIQSKNENLLLAKLSPLRIVGRDVNIFTGTYVLTPKTSYMNYLTQNYIPVFGMSLGDEWFQGQVEFHWFLHNDKVSNHLKAIQELDFKVEHFELLSHYFFRLSLYTEPGDDYPAFSKVLFEHFSLSAPHFSAAWQILTESLKQPALDIQLAFANNSELIRTLSTLPNMRFKVIPKTEKKICSLCATQRGKVTKAATHVAELTGFPYDPENFQLLSNTGHDVQKAANLCHLCKCTVQILHKVLHIMYYIKCSISSYLWGLVRELDDEEEMLDPEEVAECLLGDHEWRYGCFFEIALMIVEAREEAVKVGKRLKIAAAAACRNATN